MSSIGCPSNGQSERIGRPTTRPVVAGVVRWTIFPGVSEVLRREFTENLPSILNESEIIVSDRRKEILFSTVGTTKLPVVIKRRFYDSVGARLRCLWETPVL